MNEPSLRRLSELVRGVIELLWSKPDGLSGIDVISRLPEVINLTEFETGLMPSSALPRYARSIRLATLSLVKAGWLVKSDKGQWSITEEGRQACRRYSSPQDLFLEALRLSGQEQKAAPEMIVSLELAQEQAWSPIADYIRGKSNLEIHRLLAVLLEAMQYHIIWTAPPQKKRGLIDMVATIDPIGAKTLRILVQVRHTGQPVTAEGMKSFSSTLGSGDFGLLFSTGGFTGDARELLGKGGYQKINAMDLEKFYDLWVGHYSRLSREAHVLLPLQAVYFLSPPV